MRRNVGISLCVSLVLLVACASSIESAVDDGYRAHRVPSGLLIVYDDRAPMLGGDRIEVAEDGSIRWWTDVPAPLATGVAPEDAFDDVRSVPEAPPRAPDRTGAVDHEAMQALLGLIESIKPWNRSPDHEDDSRLERRRAFLMLRRGSDAVSSWQWVDETEPGENRITAVRRWAEFNLPRVPVATSDETSGGEQDAGPNPVLTNP